jgi:hypothetical protein
MKTTKSKARFVWFGAFLVVAVVAVAAAQVPGLFSTVNATVGYLINGAAPNGQAICGNGTVGAYSASCAINAATATALAATPSQCGTNQFSTGVTANGNANCTPIAGTPRACNSNGCYRVNSDGTIEEWGTVTAATSSETVQTVSFSFPFAFTSELSLTESAGSQPDSTNNDTMTLYTIGKTLTGATFVIRCAGNIGGSGCPSISNAVPIDWHAVGN